MGLETILKKNYIKYKKIDYEKNISIYKYIDKERTVVNILQNNGEFIIDRDLFYYLDNNKEQYSFVLENLSNNKIYYLDFKSKINWLKSSFDRTEKGQLYFGKIVLNNEVSKIELHNLL